jgi:hypothetical protein
LFTSTSKITLPSCRCSTSCCSTPSRKLTLSQSCSVCLTASMDCSFVYWCGRVGW